MRFDNETLNTICKFYEKKIYPFVIAIWHSMIAIILVLIPTLISKIPQIYNEHVFDPKVSITMLMTYSFAFLSYTAFYMFTEEKLSQKFIHFTWILILFNVVYYLLIVICGEQEQYNIVLVLLTISIIMMYIQFAINEFYKKNPKQKTVQQNIQQIEKITQESLNSGIDNYLKKIDAEK